MIFIISRNGMPRLAVFTESAAQDAIVQQQSQAEYPPLSDYVIHEVPIVHKWKLQMFGMPRTEHEQVCIRHDRMRGFNAALDEKVEEDYAVAMADIEFALSHLKEGLPNGQVMRVRSAMRALMRGAFTLLKFLTKRGVMRDE